MGKNAADAHARRLAKEAELNAANQGVPLAKSEQNGHTSLTASFVGIGISRSLGSYLESAGRT